MEKYKAKPLGSQPPHIFDSGLPVFSYVILVHELRVAKRTSGDYEVRSMTGLAERYADLVEPTMGACDWCRARWLVPVRLDGLDGVDGDRLRSCLLLSVLGL